MNVATALRQGTKLLEDGGIAAPKLTAEVLLSHALQKERVYLFTHPECELERIAWIHFGRYLHERLKGKPTQYITKKQEFYGRDFRVTPAVLIPRPETELVVEEALRFVEPGARVVDVGTGSGAIAVTIALESEARVMGCDLSRDALEIARGNQTKLGANVSWFQGDLLGAARQGSLDLIASNPPYVPLGDKEGLQREVRDFEPELALYGGPEGHEIYARLFEQAAIVLKPGGRIVVELGWRSLEAVQQIASTNGFIETSVRDDLAGIPRVLVARVPESR
jgi:release factor glutamine methyltransferase